MKHSVLRSGSGWTIVGLIGLAIIGVWLRLRNLGDLSLFVDEGVQALAVKATIREGVPLMDSGLTYLRAPIFLYMQAAFAHFWGVTEFALRFPSVLWGILTIFPTYVLGRSLFGREVGLLAAVVIALSAWEIDVSRYARPYVAFQFLYVLSLIAFFRGFIQDMARYRGIFFLVAILCFLTHELSQVIIAFFLIPFLVPTASRKLRLATVFWGVASGITMLLIQRHTGLLLPQGLSHLSAQAATSQSFLDRITSSLGLPSVHGLDLLHVESLAEHTPWLFFGAIGLSTLCAIFLVYRIVISRRGWRGLLEVAMLVSAFFHLFGMVVLLAVAYITIVNHAELREREFLLTAVAVASLFVMWAFWFLMFARISLVQVPQILFGFPDVYRYMIRWLIKGWPVLTILSLVGSIMLLQRFRRNRGNPVPLFAVTALFLPAVFASVFDSFFVPLYTVHLFPLLVIVAVFAAVESSAYITHRLSTSESRARWIQAALVLLLLLINADTNPAVAWSVSQRDYHTQKNPNRNTLTYRVYSDFHQDVKSPCTSIRGLASDDAQVLVFGLDSMTQLCHFYAEGVDYTVTTTAHELDFALVTADGRTIHYTTGIPFVTTLDEFRAIVDEHDGRTLVVTDRRALRRGHPLDEAEDVKQVLRPHAESPLFVGADSITVVLELNGDVGLTGVSAATVISTE